MHQSQADRVQTARYNLNELRHVISHAEEYGRHRRDPYDAFSYKMEVFNPNGPLISMPAPRRPVGPLGQYNSQDLWGMLDQVADVLDDLSRHIVDQETEIQDLEAAYEAATTDD